MNLKKENPTHPYNAPVECENSGLEDKNAHAPVYTHPYNAPVGSEKSTVKQAGLGFIICEQCGKEAPKKIYNQRFCCTECRLAWHGYKPTAKKG